MVSAIYSPVEIWLFGVEVLQKCDLGYILHYFPSVSGRIYDTYHKLAASPRRRGVTVALRLWLCIFNKIGKQSLRDCDLTTVASRL